MIDRGSRRLCSTRGRTGHKSSDEYLHARAKRDCTTDGIVENPMMCAAADGTCCMTDVGWHDCDGCDG